MIKTLLKQASLTALSLVIFSEVVMAQASLLNAGSIIEAGKFMNTDQSMDDVLEFAETIAEDVGGKWGYLADMVEGVETAKSYAEIGKEISNIENKFSKEAKNSINKVKEEASRALDTFEQGAYGSASTLSSDAMKATLDGVGKDIQTKAKDMATGKDMLRLLNVRVTTEMKEMGERTNEEGPGVPTLDPANMATGMFNLDSVFGANMANGGVRQEDTKMCSGMGLKDATRGDAQGMACCMQWIMSGNEESADTNSGSGGMGQAVTAIAVCCALAPDFCLSLLDVAKEKAACVNGALAAGGTPEGAFKTCEVECGKKGYGELVHNEEGKYDPKEVEDLMKSCYNAQEDKWQPSPMVLTPSELAPVVPDDVKNMLK